MIHTSHARLSESSQLSVPFAAHGREYANIDLHLGKTRVWNAAGVEPEGLAAEVPPQPGRSPVWVGAHSLPAEQQGMVVLGTPLGSDAFVDFPATKDRGASIVVLQDTDCPRLAGGLVAVAHVPGSALPLLTPRLAALFHGGLRPQP